MADKQPEALRLADAVDPLTRKGIDNLTCAAAAAELRRLAGIEAERDALAQVEAERDALLEACLAYSKWADETICTDPFLRAIRQQMRSAIDAAMKGGGNG